MVLECVCNNQMCAYKREVKDLKIDRKKYMLARARACMGQKDFEAAGIPRPDGRKGDQAGPQGKAPVQR